MFYELDLRGVFWCFKKLVIQKWRGYGGIPCGMGGGVYTVISGVEEKVSLME
jgi:hypothetical protein